MGSVCRVSLAFSLSKAIWKWYNRGKKPGFHISLEKYESVASICKFENQRRKSIDLNWILSCIVTRGIFTGSYYWRFPFLLQEAGHQRADFQMLKNSQSLNSALNSPGILKSLWKGEPINLQSLTYSIWCIKGSNQN